MASKHYQGTEYWDTEQASQHLGVSRQRFTDVVSRHAVQAFQFTGVKNWYLAEDIRRVGEERSRPKIKNRVAA